MGSLSIWHWLIVLVIVLVLFGRGRVSEIMGEFGKGIKSFKEGVNEEESKKGTVTPPPAPVAPPAQITSTEVPPVAPVAPPVAPHVGTTENKTEQN
ncbi:twin-arginine translocase TatA/TatE family subunit [Novosphingobium sp. 9]|uniref:twin-arginine translocase TatA/TatE family subunit n=1 Tax=Novosphingobium sp. 9 TaxID=2025349 RepID=UPI0021B5B88A|nr:twin-arginine translocase TatA/TatE family subunit [Novosphingobium sp. 9]